MVVSFLKVVHDNEHYEQKLIIHEAAHIAMETLCYHGDRGVASPLNGGELSEGRTRQRTLQAKAHHPYEAAHIAMETSCYHGDRGVASPLNGGELSEGRGISHAFKA
jgi:hypothetical protein